MRQAIGGLVIVSLFLGIIVWNITDNSHKCVREPGDEIRARSENASWTAYARVTDEFSLLCMVRTEGNSKPILISELELPARVSRTEWSPDGKFLAFEWDSNDDPGLVTNTQIYIFSMDWRYKTRIADQARLPRNTTSWRQDSKYLAYIGTVDNAWDSAQVYSVDQRTVNQAIIGMTHITGWDGPILVVYNPAENLGTTIVP